MRKYGTHSVLWAMALGAGVIYGFVISSYQVFPYEIIRIAYHRIQEQDKTYGPWSIGIYEGSTPFDLAFPENISNPVLTAKDVTDVDAITFLGQNTL